ncbi:MAG: N-acetylmuramoyl-L-alanine amidase [Devosiaceae bacterium]|nr:N-acetylmuramoyl-L-alanine amidase [Devosiaceae bacterium MH13]
MVAGLVALACAATLVPIGGAFAQTAPEAIEFEQPSASFARAARVAGDLERTRFVLDYDGELEPQVFILPEPRRLILDLPGTDFDAMQGASIEPRGLAQAVRFGAFAPGRGRVVVDLASDAAIDELITLPALDDQPARLVIDIVQTDAAGFSAEVERTRPVFLASVEAPKENRLDIEIPQTGQPVIVIDPGHGGIDSGAVSRSGTMEKSVVLTYAQQLADALRATGHYDVYMTRDDDTFIPLAGRVRYAQSVSADLFISVHADSLVRHRELRGATVYTLSDRASDEIAQQLVDNEARSELLAGMDVERAATSDVADILVDLTRRETERFSLAFAADVVSELSTATRMVTNPHRSAGFRVLKAPEVPSVLLELGFLSNSEDERLLVDPDWRARTVAALGTAIDRFFEQRLAQAP